MTEPKPDTLNEKMSLNRKDFRVVSIDELLSIVGEYGKFQKVVNGLFCFMAIPCIWHTMLMYFTADYPQWRCVQRTNSTCIQNGTFESDDKTRCYMSRDDWMYTESRENSLLVYYDVDCGKDWLIELVTSIFFIGWIFGACLLGWICDNIGRKSVLLVSMISVISIGFLSIFMPNIYLFIGCRFLIGFFLPGTMPQMFIIMTEIVGSRYRAFAGLLVFEFGVVSTALLGLKAYYIHNWKHLHIVCTIPYLIVVLFFKFIPESVRYLRVKDKNEELMLIFNRIAAFNGRSIPENCELEQISADQDVPKKKSNPLQLFKTKSLVMKTFVEIFGFFASGMLYYGVYLAANDLGGAKYRDYTIITVSELPVVFLSIFLCERYGRKRTCMFPMLFACAAFLALAFIPRRGNLKIFRVVFGLLGKCLVGSNMDILHTWATELYPTYLRGEAIGVFQAALRVGAASAPWLDRELVKIHKSASFLCMAVISIVSFAMLSTLPETKFTGMVDVAEGGDAKTGHKGVEKNDRAVTSFTNNCLDIIE